MQYFVSVPAPKFVVKIWILALCCSILGFGSCILTANPGAVIYALLIYIHLVFFYLDELDKKSAKLEKAYSEYGAEGN